MDTPRGQGTERLVLAIGEISASHRTVLTPAGSAPVNAVTWAIREETAPRGRGWRRALPGAGAPDTVALGVTLSVTVSGPGWRHTERVGPAGPEEVAAVRGKVTQARMLALRSVVWSPAAAAQVPAPPAHEEAAEPAR
ncbi:hypothetical protein [Pedococcus sp. P5_B7]